MDSQLLNFIVLPLDLLAEIVPYAIIGVNVVLFQLLRSFVNKLFNETSASSSPSRRFMRLLCEELISTCELCADCAELNVVYEKHGSLAYGFGLFILTYFWIEAFGEAQTSPGYMAEDYFVVQGNVFLKTVEPYARFIGQMLAMPLAWRFATLYWKYHLLSEHSAMLVVENCKSSLTTSTINGFIIEFVCCLLCRLVELIGNSLLERKKLSQRLVSATCSFICTLLVVLALELSGGYFNPVLASSLEYGCKGTDFYQHALVFWLGPLLGHILARSLFRKYGTITPKQPAESRTLMPKKSPSPPSNQAARKPERTRSQRRKRVANE